ncbi:hypothetical protein GOBAR_DD32098 [Gossypium barbadense]|nr:hypothetical protein GOBAR_DD32098 [Gossypium barbadense]
MEKSMLMAELSKEMRTSPIVQPSDCGNGKAIVVNDADVPQVQHYQLFLKEHVVFKKVSQLPNEKETIYRALDKWVAWETEFPLIAAVKALQIFKKRSQWEALYVQ